MTVHMKATKAFPYAGRRLAVGDEFDARGKQDARLLIAIGKAVEFTPEVEAKYPQQHAASVFKPNIPKSLEDVLPAGAAPDVDQVHPTTVTVDSVVTNSLPAEPTEVVPAEKPKRQYRRRDMTASDSE